MMYRTGHFIFIIELSEVFQWTADRIREMFLISESQAIIANHYDNIYKKIDSVSSLMS